MARRLDRNEEVQAKLRSRYLKGILAKHPNITADDVLWIGPLSDGLVKFGIFLRRKGTDRGRGRGLEQSWAGFMSEVAPEQLDTCKGFEDTALGFMRQGMEPMVNLTYNVVADEPGAILTSPATIENKETGLRETLWDPKIREDKRFGLHYLLRGDKFLKVLRPRRRNELGQELKWEWVLRPLSEGSSFITPAQREKQVASY